MPIAVIGSGRIGSAFARHLGRAGHDVTLASVLSHAPLSLSTAMLRGASRASSVCDLGQMGPADVQSLIDSVTSAAGRTQALQDTWPR